MPRNGTMIVGRSREDAGRRAEWLRNWARGVWYQVNSDLARQGLGTISSKRFWEFAREESQRRCKSRSPGA